ncbi:hypothetical protein ACWEKT_14070 [Nocardia takedensis]
MSGAFRRMDGLVRAGYRARPGRTSTIRIGYVSRPPNSYSGSRSFVRTGSSTSDTVRTGRTLNLVRTGRAISTIDTCGTIGIYSTTSARSIVGIHSTTGTTGTRSTLSPIGTDDHIDTFRFGSTSGGIRRLLPSVRRPGRSSPGSSLTGGRFSGRFRFRCRRPAEQRVGQLPGRLRGDLFEQFVGHGPILVGSGPVGLGFGGRAEERVRQSTFRFGRHLLEQLVRHRPDRFIRGHRELPSPLRSTHRGASRAVRHSGRGC